VKERLAADGAEAVGGTPAAFAALIKEELDKWKKVAHAAGIEPQ
jgi:tripartite-type tricarboxylate transporter receptor subunit TctC